MFSSRSRNTTHLLIHFTHNVLFQVLPNCNGLIYSTTQQGKRFYIASLILVPGTNSPQVCGISIYFTSRGTKCLRYRLSSRMCAQDTALENTASVYFQSNREHIYYNVIQLVSPLEYRAAVPTANYKRWNSLGSGFPPGMQFPEFPGEPQCQVGLQKSKEILIFQAQ